MESIHDLREIFTKIAVTGARQGRSNVVTNTIKRVLDRESDAAFGVIDRFYHPADVSSVQRSKGTNTKVILIKPVGDHCNLRCTYCYEIQRLTGSHEKVMSVEQIKQYLINFVGRGSDVSDIFLHGGEPLLAGKKFFQAFIDTLKELGFYGHLTLGVQTNATLLDQDWVDFFKEHKFNIGVSLDGDREFNDKYRIDHKGRGSYDRVMKGIRLLQQNDIDFGIISVVSTDIAKIPGSARRILNHHIDIGVKYVDIHPAFTPDDTSGSSAECNMSRQQYTDFMTELAYAWAQSSNPELRLRCMEDLLQNLSDVKSPSCYASGYCTSILGIDPSGAVSPCTRPFHEEYNFGNAGELKLSELEDQPAFKKFVADEQEGQNKASSRQWSVLCGSGNCPHERFTNGKQDPAGKHIFCSCHDQDDSTTGYPGFYKNFGKVLTEFHEWLLEAETVQL